MGMFELECRSVDPNGKELVNEKAASYQEDRTDESEAVRPLDGDL